MTSAAAAPPLPQLPHGVSCVTERRAGGGLFVHPGWAERMPWLAQGITARSADMSLFADSPAGAVVRRWTAVRDAERASVIIHARQVHAGAVLAHDRVPAGLYIGPDADGHATAQPGALLAVSVADCVPVSMVAPARRAVALLHGGWRGVAAGILEAGLAAMREQFGAAAADLHIHLGPAICGDCFEVGPEVPAGLGLHAPDGPKCRVDLRAVLARRAADAGVPVAVITTSTFCTRCGDSPFYSHRGGCAERQIAILGVRTES